jgi:L-amino acid N-acyltransferase YncA
MAFDGGRVAGCVALSPVSLRRVHPGVAEVGVYVAAEDREQQACAPAPHP